MKSAPVRCGVLCLLLAMAVLSTVWGQDLVRATRTLESDALEVWQSTQSRFLQLNFQGRLSDEDLQLYFDLNAFARSTTLLRELSNTVNPRDLRGGVQALVAQAVALENLFDGSRPFANQFELWRSVQRSLAVLARASGTPYAPLGRTSVRDNPDRDRRTPEYTGRLWWKGHVDGKDYIRLQGDKVVIEHLEAIPIRDDSYDLSSSLPRRAIPVTLKRIRGRGQVEIVEQPSARNGFAVVILVEDKKGGADTYEFELHWEASEPARRIP